MTGKTNNNFVLLIHGFCLDGFYFKLVSSEKETSDFYDLVFSVLHETLELPPKSKEYSSIKNQCMEMDEIFADILLKVIVYNQSNEAVGTIGAYLDTQKKLPCEIKENLNCSALRKYGNLMELGRMSVRKDHRHYPCISFGLLKSLYDIALNNEIDIFLESTFPSRIMMFKRIGLQVFKKGESFDKIYQTKKILSYFNFAVNLYNYSNAICANSNYSNKLFSLVDKELLGYGYNKLLARNSNRTKRKKSYNIDYAKFLQ